MTQRRLFLAPLLALLLAVVATPSAAPAAPDDTLPARLNDEEFWKLSQDLSEPNGYFRSDNLVSNEIWFQYTLDDLLKRTRPGGVYLGVGPEQNFTYIARVRPAMAYIVDIRRENRTLHLFYKALFELSSDRADFVARLFSRPRPEGLDRGSSVKEIFERFDAVGASAEQLQWNAGVVRKWLVETRKLPLEANDLAWIDRLFLAFAEHGPSIQYWQARDTEPAPSYRRLMTIPDSTGFARSFLASEDDFRFVKDLQARNMIVPVVGDFGGPSALRQVGEDVRARRRTVTVFYGSNVGVYLTNEQTRAFCRNLASLPASEDAVFIERDGVQRLAARLKSCK